MRIGRHFLRESAEFGECGSGGVGEKRRRGSGGEEANQVFDGEAESSRMFFRTFGWRILPAWEGTVTRRPVSSI
jgi:hypothetical protein